MSNNLILDNHAVYGGGLDFCYFWGSLSEPLVDGNTLRRNVASFGGGGVFSNDATPHLSHLTMDENRAGQRGGGVFSANGSTVTLVDCIVARGGGGGGLAAAGGSIVTDHCDVWNNSGGDYIGCMPSPTDLSGDPIFCPVDPEIGLSLYETSCCQGSGSGGSDIGSCAVGCFTVPEVFFYDNFSDQNSSGWRIETFGQSTLEVASGMLSAEASTPGSYCRALVESEPSIWDDYDLRLKLRPENLVGSLPGWLDVYLRHDQAERCYHLRLNGEEGEMWKHDGGAASLMALFDCVLSPEASTQLRVIAHGSYLRGSVLTPSGDEILLFDLLDPEDPILYGTFGVGAESVSGPLAALFDEVLAARADAADTPMEPAGSRVSDGDLHIRVEPNPIQGGTAVRFTLPAPGCASLTLYDLSGGRVRDLLAAKLPEGTHDVHWDGLLERGRPAAAGVYFLRLATGQGVRTERILVVR